jgi:hypothetical protein
MEGCPFCQWLLLARHTSLRGLFGAPPQAVRIAATPQPAKDAGNRIDLGGTNVGTINGSCDMAEASSRPGLDIRSGTLRFTTWVHLL